MLGLNIDNEKNVNYNFSTASGAQKINRAEEEKERLSMFE